MRLLIVEHSAPLRRSLAELCIEGDAAVELRTAATLAEAWWQLRDFAPQVAIIELALPHGACRALLRSLPGLAEPPVVLVIGDQPGLQHRERYRALGADYVLDRSGDAALLPLLLDGIAAAAGGRWVGGGMELGRGPV